MWFLGTPDANSLRASLRQTPGTAFFSMTTSEGVQASMLSGPSVAGLTASVGQKVDCFARVRDHSTDFFLTLTFTEALIHQTTADATSSTTIFSIQTNMDISVRIQIPKSNGVLLIKHSPSPDHTAYGILLDPL
jgi:hypothetical protein